MIADALALIDFLKKNKDQYVTKSALFQWDGAHLEGSKEVEIEIIRFQEPEKANQWFYRVKPKEGYVFVHMPLIPGAVHVDNGQLVSDTNPNAEIFRYVGNMFSAVMSGGNPNVKTNFIVVGYRPKDLLNLKEK